MQPECSLVPTPARFAKKVVRGLHYDGKDLVIEIQGDEASFARVVFRRPIGFRVLDERDLCEYWPRYSEPNGWLWEVHGHGWMDLERQRPLFNSDTFAAPLLEFFVVDNMCVHVLCNRPPEFVER